jgi:hypothetical protein
VTGPLRFVWHDLWLSSGGSRSWVRSIVYWLPVAALTIWSHGDLYAGGERLSGLSHAQRSMDTAVSAAYCGRPGLASSRYSIYVFLKERADLMSQPFRNVMAAQAVSVSNYCATVNAPIVVEENSLYWLERLMIGWNGHITPEGVGQTLGAIRMLMIVIFGLGLLRTGSSILFTTAALMLAGDLAGGLRDTAYPFATLVPLLTAGVYGVAACGKPAKDGGAWLFAFALAMGTLAAFSAGLRTNQLLVSVSMFAVFLASVHFGAGRLQKAASLRSLAVAAVMFGVGYGVYVAVFVVPLRNRDVLNYSYHTFAHPLVLGLGVPENDLSRREGITWIDERGEALARQVVPDVTYLGPDYEAALMRYWFGLWRRYPRDMAATYFVKLRSTGTGVFLAAGSIARRYGIPCAVSESIESVTNGLVLAVMGLAAFAISFFRSLKSGSNRLLIVALISVAALLTFVEGFLTYSIFVGLYFSCLLYFVFFLFFVLIQAGVDRLAALRAMGTGSRA